MKTSLATRIKEYCEQEEINFRTSYSGRGMFGTECCGITKQSDGDFQDFINELEDSGTVNKTEARKLRKPKTDSMGKSIIFYWKWLKSDPE